MKWNRRTRVPTALLVVLLLAAAFTAKGDLPRWVQDIPSPSALQSIFFRTGQRRPPKDTRPELSRLIAASPAQANLFALRAHEAELQLDFSAAENDWKRYVQITPDLSLADYYHRRNQPAQEIAALEAAARRPSPPGEKLTPATHQESWKAFQRIQEVIANQALGPDLAATEFRAWMARYPAEPAIPKLFFYSLEARKETAQAQAVLADYRRAFPADDTFPLEAAASLAPDPLRVYDQNFQPLWPSGLIKNYFEHLKTAHRLREFLASAHAAETARPLDIEPAARLYYYYAQQENPAAALRALYGYRRRKDASRTPWSQDELWTLGQLFERANHYDEAASGYYALYSSNPERALAALASVLLTAPEQAIHIGQGDLSFYRDIAALDPGPGFLNGVLSLLFNSTAPEAAYATENQAGAAYFHRAKASELIAELDRRFPDAAARPALHARLLDAYVTYGDDAGVLRSGREFLSSFPKSEDRPRVALLMADAYARENKPAEEFAIYNALLAELAAQSDNVPLGEGLKVVPDKAETTGARSPEYARVLDRYVGRLVALKRIPDALALYRRELGRNPNDPGLYERFSGFLEQNNVTGEAERVYRQAIAQFPDRSWSDKLARWYLRRKQTAQFDALTREVVKTFSGLELEAYLIGVGHGPLVGATLYRQVNLYAHQRFPYDLAFVRNLLFAYGTRGTADPAAAEALLRTYWCYAPDLRARFFELLSRTGKLKAELAANHTGPRFAAEAEVWQSHFEAAAPLLREVADLYPGDVDHQTRAASVYRSMHATALAAALEENVTKAEPLAPAGWTRVGEIFADRDQFRKAKPYWERIAALEPGKAAGYVEAATIFWDYYQFDDALRMLAEGRRRLNDDRLFSYEAGAIYENQRNYARAIQEYAKGALLAAADVPSRERLVRLSRRPAQRSAIEELTAQASAGPNAALPAVSLRFDVLNEQGRTQDARQFLLAAASGNTSLEVLRFVDRTAAARAFDNVEREAKLREVALTTDPVEHMQTQLALMRFFEGRHATAPAARVIGEVYRENPAILGVVRAAVDFYWRNKDPRRAVDTLEQAAARAQPDYRNPFLLEASRKAAEAGDYARSRGFLATLLQQSPFDPAYVAAMADTYARQGDDKGLRDFYTARLQAVQPAQLTPPEKTAQTAALRRGLIPVLTRLKDYTGAVDQYIEVLNRYPEDADLVREAAAYAASHGQGPQLVAYYENTARQSPRDFRWPMVEARVQMQLEDFPAAAALYRRAAAIRPDRLYFYTERAAVEERLLDFDAAAATYAKLYELNYHNSQWMEKLAAVRARQGRADEAVKALHTALIEGRPPDAAAFFAAARTLESWNLLQPARDDSEKGLALAGGNALGEYTAGVGTYARILTRLRQYDPAYRKIAELARGKDPKEVRPWVDAALLQMGAAVKEFYTPEEKSAFASFAGTRLQQILPALRGAGLLDLEAKALAYQPRDLAQLEQRRLRFGELAAFQEAYWKQLAPESENRDSYLDQAAANYKLAEDPAAELRVLALKDRQGTLNGAALDRYVQLLARTPAQLEAAASSDQSAEVRNAAANYAIQAGNAARSFRVVTARGRELPPVWTRAYTALTGLYFASNTPAVNQAFVAALGNGTIGERLGKPVDRSQQLVGDVWFYYGSRYGEYLDSTKQPGAEDYLPAAVEARPGNAEAYFELGEYYASAGRIEPAAENYRDALQLDSLRADAHDRLGVIAAKQGRRDEAIAEFRAALDASARRQDARHVAESFWTGLQTTLEDLGRAHLLDPLRPAADRVLRTYIRRNGSFRAEPLLQGAIAAADVAWVIDLSGAAPDRPLFLSAIVAAEWIPEAQRSRVYQALIDATRALPDRDADLRRYEIDYATYLVQHQRSAEAATVLADVPQPVRIERLGQIVPLEIRIAAQTKKLPALLTRYAAEPDLLSRLDFIRNSATELRTAGDPAAARQVLEFVYTRQIEARQLTASAFLGLAEIRLEQGNLTPGNLTDAVALLRRMTLIVGEPFENLPDAANLLIAKGHAPEAIPFLEGRVKAVPWDAAARVALAKAQGATDALKAIAMSNDAVYGARVEAARSLRTPLSGTSGELVALSSGPIAPAAAEKPYFYYARIEAAAQAKEPAVQVRLLLAAIAIDPDPQKPRFDLIQAAVQAKRWRTAVAAAPETPVEDKSLARALARAHENLGELVEAQAWFRNSGADADVKRLETAIARRSANDARRPVVSANLEQDRPVRPRLAPADGGSQ